ncbi:MAG TPA: tRNA (adenosine(37)-N6)-threonylcarbamoyltransferase complex transferase subunit TsaD [Syntrophorhabdales bacterium]|nr:tRNA (adenosine(37)-N6)-threonylcarbamoyltransferase complex transferase subunit TsaD [Syntrophorhabdales bacterium]
MIVLGIDTSCDDTSIALLKDGTVLSNVVSSQVQLHSLFGGIVPELASRKHIELIDRIYEKALAEARVSLADIGCVAVTNGPGLIGSLLAGLMFAKGLCLSASKPMVAVNHVEAHAMSIFLEQAPVFPFVALIVSGGHTVLLLFEEPCRYRLIGSTRDDAAGEAFDKIAKYLGLGYPGGRVLEEIAAGGRPDAISFPRPMLDEKNYDFSFSGLKTAFVNFVKRHGITESSRADIVASFQEAICDVLCRKTMKVLKDYDVTTLVVGGGVAANGRLRALFEERAAREKYRVLFPSRDLCTDNAAMVAITGDFYAERNLYSPETVKGFSRMARG